MDLQELLKKATKRPWWLEGHHLMGTFEQATPKSEQSKLIASMDKGHETAKFDAILQRHAVNNLEQLVEELTVIATVRGPLTGSDARGMQIIAQRALRKVGEITPNELCCYY